MRTKAGEGPTDQAGGTSDRGGALLPRQHVGNGIDREHAARRAVDGGRDGVLVDDGLAPVVVDVAVAEEDVDEVRARLGLGRHDVEAPDPPHRVGRERGKVVPGVGIVGALRSGASGPIGSRRLPVLADQRHHRPVVGPPGAEVAARAPRYSSFVGRGTASAWSMAYPETRVAPGRSSSSR